MCASLFNSRSNIYRLSTLLKHVARWVFNRLICLVSFFSDVVDKEKDPSMPLISNVVSLSSVASSSSSVTPPPPTRSEESPSTQPPSPTPSAESGNGNVRRTTLRFKRGIEISFEVDQNGQPVTVNNHEVSSTPSASSGEPRQ